MSFSDTQFPMLSPPVALGIHLIDLIYGGEKPSTSAEIID
jgi:hypothetical protein